MQMKRQSCQTYLCSGDVAIYSAVMKSQRKWPVTGKLILSKEGNGNWVLIVEQNRNSRKFRLNDFILKKLPPDFLQKCLSGSIVLHCTNSESVSFKPNSASLNRDVPDFAKMLWELKQKNQHGNVVHDMFANNTVTKPITRSHSLGPSSTENKTFNETRNRSPEAKRNFFPLHAKSNGDLTNGITTTPNRFQNSRLVTIAKGKPVLTLKENSSNDLILRASASNFESLGNSAAKLNVPEGSSNDSENQVLTESNKILKRQPILAPDLNGDSDEENNDRSLNQKLVVKKCNTTPAKNDKEKTFTPRLSAGITSPRLSAGNFYRKNDIPSRLNQRDYSSPRTPNLSLSKRQSILTPDSPAKKSKLSSEVDNKENEGKQITTLPYGFPNLGNTCYMNSVLQTLYTVITDCQTCEAAFINFYRKTINNVREDLLTKHFCRLLELVKSTNSENTREQINRALQNLKLCFQSMHSTFKGDGMQEIFQLDAHEFWTCLQSKLRDEINKNMPNINSESSAGRSLIDCYFRYTLVDVAKCTKCSNEVSTQRVDYDVGVNTCEKHLQSCLHSLFKSSKRQISCEKCENKESTVTTKIIELPRILVIYVKRYNCNEANPYPVKDDTKVKAPKYITLDCFADDEASLSILPDEFKTRPDETYLNGEMFNHAEGHGNSESAIKPVNVDGKGDGCNEIEPMWPSVEDDEDDDDLKRAKEASLEEYNQSLILQSCDDICEEEVQTSLEATGNERHSYRLMSYITHYGVMNSGHYVSYGFDCKRKKYFCFDDRIVTDESEEKFYSDASMGYIFVYIHRDMCLENVPNSIARFTQPFNSLS